MAKQFVKITLNQSSAFEREILREMDKENRAGSLKRLAYEGILHRRFLCSLHSAEEIPQEQMPKPVLNEHPMIRKLNMDTGITDVREDIMGDF